MPLRIVFLRNDKSLISRAIMWFTQHRKKPETRCSHVLVKFKPHGVLGLDWWVYEAMERGCWPSPWIKSLGRQTVVAEFEICREAVSQEVALAELLGETCGNWYDYEGIWKWAWRIITERFFGTLVRWFKIAFRPGHAHEGLFCSGLVLECLRKIQEKNLDLDFGITNLTPRTSSPQNEIDACLGHPLVYKGGLGPIEKAQA